MTPLRPIETLTQSQISQLHQLYQNEWWSESRSLDDVKRMLDHTDLMIGLVDQRDELVAFCRVLTDFVYRAMVYDVMVASEWRNQGIGRKIMDCLVGHPRLTEVSSITLHCRGEMIPFYEKWGFELRGSESRIMCKRQGRG